MSELNLKFTKDAEKRIEFLFKHYSDIFNSVSVLLRRISLAPDDAGLSLPALKSLREPTDVDRRVIETVDGAGSLPTDFHIGYQVVPDRALPPPNIAIVGYHPGPRIVFVVGYIPRSKLQIRP